MNIFVIVSIVLGGLLLIGFLFGMLRSWKKSLIRFGIIVLDVILALFLSPVISKLFINKITNGTSISIFKFNFDISGVLTDVMGENVANDLLAANSTTNEFVTAIVNIFANIILFFVMFILLWLISLLVYAIVTAVVHHSSKKKYGENAKKKQNIGFRFIGGFIGLISMTVIFGCLLIPVFGTVNILDKFLEKNPEQEQVAAAYSPTSKLASENLYYKDNESIGQIETYIEKYSEIKKSYSKSFAGVFFKYTGFEAFGKFGFDYLTTVKSGNLKVSLTDETVVVIDVYNSYKEAFVENKFDITDNNSIDRISKIYDKAVESKILSSYIVELVPTMSAKWSAGEKFLGMECPIKGEFQPVVSQILKVFSVKSNERINSNVKVLFNVVKVANNSGLISGIKENLSIIEILSGENTFVKDIILTLTSTEELKTNLPNVLNEMIKVFYDSMVGGENPIKDLSESQIVNINWEFEASNTQEIFNLLTDVYDVVSSNNTDETLAQLGTIGKIDLSRKSAVLSDSLKSFFIGFINSGKIDFGSENGAIIEKLLSHITDYWDYEGNDGKNKDFSFEATFKVIQETAEVAKKFKGDEKPSISELKDVIGELLESDSDVMKEAISDLLKTDEVGDMFGTEGVGDVLAEFIEGTSKDTLDKDIEAAQKLVDILDASASKEENPDGSLSKESSDQIVEAVIESENIMDMLDKAANSTEEENNSIKKAVDGLSEQDKAAIQGSLKDESVQQKIAEAGEAAGKDYKGILDKLFGNAA